MRRALSDNLNYASLKLIGKGGFCRVYEGSHLQCDEPVAIKAVNTKYL